MAHLIDSVARHLEQVSPFMALLIMAIGMMLESMCVPIPSEVILILAGWYVARGKFGGAGEGFADAMIAVTAGCLVGSSLAYAAGYYGGKSFVEKYGRYILVTPHRLEVAERWIARFGPGAIFLGRLMFAVRALISFPVGILRMGYSRFILFTLLGGATWNAIGLYLGYTYGEKVEGLLHRMSVGMFVIVALLIVLAAGVYFWKTHLATGTESEPVVG